MPKDDIEDNRKILEDLSLKDSKVNYAGYMATVKGGSTEYNIEQENMIMSIALRMNTYERLKRFHFE